MFWNAIAVEVCIVKESLTSCIITQELNYKRTEFYNPVQNILGKNNKSS